MTLRYTNFGAGPSHIPSQIIKDLVHDLDNFNNTHQSILEIGHRTHEFIELTEELLCSIKDVLNVPDDFTILLMPAGAQAQFAITAMNLTAGFSCANYVDTGHWSSKALKEASKYTSVHLCYSAASSHYHTIEHTSLWNIDNEGAYIHYCDNETIGGLEFKAPPLTNGLLLVCDMSSNIFSRTIDFSRFGCIYACAQKNMGIAGMSLVIVRKDWLDRALTITPSVFNYKVQHEAQSMAATPPTICFYVALKMMQWLKKMGSLDDINQLSIKKSSLLYDFIDKSSLYHNPIHQDYRSRMNVPFLLKNESLNDLFLKFTKEQGLLNLKGHRSVGGMRASLYNAITLEDVHRLIDSMRTFEQEHG